MASSKVSNCSGFQAKSMNQTKTFLERALQERLANKPYPECVTHLAKDLVVIMTRYKQEELIAQASIAGISTVSLVKNIAHSNLLKTATYRVLLDAWMLEHVKIRNLPLQHAMIRERELRVKLLESANFNRYLQDELNSSRGMKNHSTAPGSAITTALQDDLDSAYRALDSLLSEFDDFLAIEDGRLVVNNSLRRTLVDAADLYGFLEWKQAQLSRRRLNR